MAIHCRPPLTVAMLATTLMFVGCVSRSEPRPPSDAELIEHFRKNKTDFETLVSMLKMHKQLTTLYQDGSYGNYNYQDGSFDKNAISPERASEYHALLNRCGMSGQEVTSYADQDSQFVEISLWHWNSRPLSNAKGIMKGYVYSTKKLGSQNVGKQVVETHWPWGAKGPLKDTLDDADQGQLGPGQHWYRSIENNWYLYVNNLHYDSGD
jgi:hypothetical protein